MTHEEQIARFIDESDRIVVFTGAGISTESGIPDYRSKGGLWERFQPVTIQEFMSSATKRAEYWRHKFELMEAFGHVEPNAGHKAIADLDRTKKLKGIVTQNIDGLHQMAGIAGDKILELHGTNRETICVQCGRIRDWSEAFRQLKSGVRVPQCDACGGDLKANTISFGQALDPDVMAEAAGWVKNCDLLIAVGSTLVVQPAASYPLAAKQRGARLVIINLSETPLDKIADLKVCAGAGGVLSGAMEIYRERTRAKR